MNYKHTQFGWVMVVGCGTMLIVFLVISQAIPAPTRLPFFAITSIMAAMLILMGTLTVEVDSAAVRLRFGTGLIRKTFPLDEIVSCRPVRNEWWRGWGIKLIPGGWLFNVSGLDAVELKMKNGRVYRIGTDEPQKLAEFIKAKAAGAV